VSGKTVAVIGSGITGLATAFMLGRNGSCDILLIERERPGGKILTLDFEGMPVEAGPDGIVIRGEEQFTLLRELNIEKEIMKPTGARGSIYARGKLRPIPQGLIMGFPKGSITPLIKSGIISMPGLLRASLDIVLPRTKFEYDISAGELAARRFGREFKETIVDTLLGGIMASGSDRISTREVLPNIYEAALKHRSIIFGMRKAPSASQPQSVVSFRGGLRTLSDALLKNSMNTEFIMDEVREIARNNGTFVVLGNERYSADAVVVCTLASSASSMLRSISQEASDHLSKINFTSVAVVLLSYDNGSLSIPPGCSGFLVSPREGLMMTACTFLTSKWPIDGKRTVVRCFVGRDNDTAWKKLRDEEIAERMHRELSSIIDVREHFLDYRVIRWDDAFPQLNVGHADAVSGARKNLPRGIFLAGSSYSGVGIASCLAGASSAVRDVISFLGSSAQ